AKTPRQLASDLAHAACDQKVVVEQPLRSLLVDGIFGLGVPEFTGGACDRSRKVSKIDERGADYRCAIQWLMSTCQSRSALFEARRGARCRKRGRTLTQLPSRARAPKHARAPDRVPLPFRGW